MISSSDFNTQSWLQLSSLEWFWVFLVFWKGFKHCTNFKMLQYVNSRTSAWQIIVLKLLRNRPYVSHAHKIMIFQSPVSQKLGRILKQTGSFFYSTMKSICTKKLLFVGCILSELLSCIRLITMGVYQYRHSPLNTADVNGCWFKTWKDLG